MHWRWLRALNSDEAACKRKDPRSVLCAERLAKCARTSLVGSELHQLRLDTELDRLRLSNASSIEIARARAALATATSMLSSMSG
jgi:hypothetical protein